ncbi:hypothetical protein RclHR1_19930002 [Rhizophagus clarus]|uniref:Uncharacterized protein n=1 Tax=Rhizophagus clarus TaxID=94130 RepID=A0A2Z6RIF8_9GLOM|nr:hypothetical protein RclHR1_19930002 [Rhizophagus clarus]
MQYFCSCHICKINPGGGKWLSTKKTFKKHQEKEKAFIEKINESETESSSELISSYIVTRKRKFDDELDELDINLVNSLSDNESLDNKDFNGDNGNPNQDYNNYNEIYNIDDDNQSFNEDYNDDNPNQNYNNYNENYNGDNDNQSLDEDYNDNDPSQDYNGEDNPSLNNDENNKVEDIETESDISDENDELTEMDNKFKDIKDINDERLIIQYKDKERAEELQYRNIYSQTKGENGENEKIYTDIFNGMLYQDLLQRDYFKDKKDIALSGLCDGYQIFKQKTDDCWIVLLINNNLPSHIYVKKENLLVTMIIPGLHSPKDFNSFLYPLVKELQELEEGIPYINGRTNEQFILRAHLLTWTGDIPALSKA